MNHTNPKRKRGKGNGKQVHPEFARISPRKEVRVPSFGKGREFRMNRKTLPPPRLRFGLVFHATIEDTEQKNGRNRQYKKQTSHRFRQRH